MSRWAFIHPASGAIVMVTTSSAATAPAHLERRAAPIGVDPGLHWWNGWSFAPRADAAITAEPDALAQTATIACPADAWLSLPDGSMTADRVVPVPGGRRCRVTLIGRHRGEVWIEGVAP